MSIDIKTTSDPRQSLLKRKASSTMRKPVS